MIKLFLSFLILYLPYITYAKDVKTNNVITSKKDLIFTDQIEEYLPKKLPEIEFYDINDTKHLLEEYDNNIVILHFWATWCTVCVHELPGLDRLKKDFKKEPIKIIALSEDFKGQEAVKEFYNHHNIKNLEIYIDKKNQLFSAFNIIGLPTTIFINKNNTEIARIAGEVDWYDEKLREKILSY
ncbi:MAG: TlpA family protein disulfide reductase [Alphaproteobacteria bacterium]